jgi:multiple sugar transport system substrate-binding protein
LWSIAGGGDPDYGRGTNRRSRANRCHPSDAGGAEPAATAATQATTAPAAPSGGSANLTFVCDTINEAHTKLRDEWTAQFTEANPNITVEHQVVPQDYPIRIQTLYAAGTPPDIYRYLQENTPIVTVVQNNLHLQLDELVAGDSYDLTDFRPDAVELYRWDGGLYALPRDYGNQNLFYNINLLQEAGVELPTADWTDTGFTFQVFRDMAQKLTKKEGERTTQWGFLINRGWRPWASWIYNNGATVVERDEQGLATAISLTEPNAVEALQFIQDLMYKDGFSPRPDVEADTGGFELFASGRVAMMINNPSAISQYRTIEAFEWDVATLPLGKAERRGTGGGGTGWAISNGTKAPQQAWEFLKFIASADAELAEVAIGATTPARTSVVTSEQFLDPSKPPKNVKAFADAQEYVVRDPVNARWPEVLQRVVTTNMDQLWSGAMTGEQVAQAIKSAGDPLLQA